MVDRELREVDALLGEQRRHRLAVRRIAGAGAPERLAGYVRTIGWQPVDARLFIGEVPQLIERLGGEKLYGDRPWIAVRELMQNAMDAVRARRVLDELPKDWGAVTIWVDWMEEDTAAGAWYLHIEDNGIGMSTACVRDYLLNFGASYWTSDLVRKEHPGLIASRIRQTGQFGIGFFSIFMVGYAVRVVTRPLGGAARDTVVLEFSRGLAGRPLLRNARPDEQLRDSGTRVSVRLSNSPFTQKGFTLHNESAPYDTLAGLVAFLCPASDVTITTNDNANTTPIILADDWKRIDPVILMMRLWGISDLGRMYDLDALDPDRIKEFATSMTFIYDKQHNVIGRASLLLFASNRTGLIERDVYIRTRVAKDSWLPMEQEAKRSATKPPGGFVTTSSGFKIEPLTYTVKRFLQKKLTMEDEESRAHPLQGLLDIIDITGILHGTISDITRSQADIPVECLADWATEQGKIATSLIHCDSHTRHQMACQIDLLGGEVCDLPIALSYAEWLTEDDLEKHLLNMNDITIILMQWRMPEPPFYWSLDWDKIYTSFFGYTTDQTHEFIVDNLYEYLGEIDVLNMKPSQYAVGFIKYIFRAVCKAWKLKPSELRDRIPLKVDGTLECESITLSSGGKYPGFILERRVH